MQAVGSRERIEPEPGPRALVGRRLAAGGLLSVGVHAAAVLALVLAAGPGPKPSAIAVDLVIVTPEAQAPDHVPAEHKTTVRVPRQVARSVPQRTGHQRERSDRDGRVEPSEPATLPRTDPGGPPTSATLPLASLQAPPSPNSELPPTSTAAVAPESGPGPRGAAMSTTPSTMPDEPAGTASEPGAKHENAALSASRSRGSPEGARTPAVQGARSGQSDPAPSSRERFTSVPATSTEQAGFSAPRLRREGQLVYPESARAAGLEGTVIVKVRVLATGKVGAVEIARSAGSPLLDRAAIESIRTAQFMPARRGDAPIPVWVEIPVDFKLER